jgi:hypothetical protein
VQTSCRTRSTHSLAAYVSRRRDDMRLRPCCQRHARALPRLPPVFSKVSVGAIDTALVTKVLQPLWTKKPETARRVRGRIEAILDWAKACGYRDGENPVRFRGHLKHLLADIPEVRRVKHHAALPYAEISQSSSRTFGNGPALRRRRWSLRS